MSSSQPSPAEAPAVEPLVPTVVRLVRINTSRRTILTINGVEVMLGGTVAHGRFQLAVVAPEGSTVRHEKVPVIPRKEVAHEQ